jgi:hypothetical protein
MMDFQMEKARFQYKNRFYLQLTAFSTTKPGLKLGKINASKKA